MNDVVQFSPGVISDGKIRYERNIFGIFVVSVAFSSVLSGSFGIEVHRLQTAVVADGEILERSSHRG